MKATFLSLFIFLFLCQCGGNGNGTADTDEDTDQEPSEEAVDTLPDIGPCESDADCSDGLVCNGMERCEDGECRPGETPECDDGDPCTKDYCSEDYGGCYYDWIDEDRDGYVDMECGGTDCNDSDGEVYPGAPEGCNVKDNDCDEEFGVQEDEDRDGFVSEACGGDDCDDTDPLIYPGADERCNMKDDDCDGEIPEDFDEDGYASSECGGDDCDDLLGEIHPNADEGCNGIDNDCDGLLGEEEDEDGDNHASEACDGDDCNDTDPLIHPGADERCNAIDDDCDGEIPDDGDEDTYADEECGGDDCDDSRDDVHPGADEGCDMTDNDCDGWLGIEADMDRDGYGAMPCGGDDCNPSDPEIHPEAEERCNAIDDDCDGIVPDDVDGDGYPAAACGGNDCDDGEAAANPDEEEVCDGIDNDCSGDADDLFPCVQGLEVACTTECETIGSGPCTETCQIPEGDLCDPPEEECNLIDDDCDDLIDEDVFGKIGSEVLINSGGGEIVGVPVIAWSGSVWGSGWIESNPEGKEVYFAVHDSDGTIIGSEVLVFSDDSDRSNPPCNMDAAWNGEDFGIVFDNAGWLEASGILYARVSDGGFLIGSPTYLFQLSGVPSPEHWVQDPMIVYSGSDYYFIWKEIRDFHTDEQIYLGKFNRHGIRIGPDVNVNDVPRAYGVDLVWTGSEIAVAWCANNHLAIKLKRYHSDLYPVTGDIELSGDFLYCDCDCHYPERHNRENIKMLWDGSSFAIAWTGEGGNALLFNRFDLAGLPILDGHCQISHGKPDGFGYEGETYLLINNRTGTRFDADGVRVAEDVSVLSESFEAFNMAWTGSDFGMTALNGNDLYFVRVGCL